MKKTDYTSSCQQRILKVLLVMFGHEIDGLAPGQIAKLAEITPQEATRDIHNLIEAGVAERLPHNDNVRISPLMGRKAMQVLATLDTAQRRVDEVRNRFTRTN